jgi:hypothetical protein
MNKLFVASLLALPLSAASQQNASAGEFRIGASCSLSFYFSGSCGSQYGCGNDFYSGCSPWGGGYGMPGAYDAYGWSGYADGGTPISTPAPAATHAAAPVQAAQYPGSYASWGYQPVGYYQSPSYWPGR